MTGGIRGQLVRLEHDLPALPGDPKDGTRLAFRLTLANGSSAPLALGSASFNLVACDGSAYAPVEDDARRTFPEELDAGEGNACRTQLGFPLVLGAGQAAATDNATPPVMPTCAGPSATAGAATGGDGCAGADGAPAGPTGSDDGTAETDAADGCRETPAA